MITLTAQSVSSKPLSVLINRGSMTHHFAMTITNQSHVNFNGTVPSPFSPKPAPPPAVETLVISSLTSFIELAFLQTYKMTGKKLGDYKKTIDPKFEFEQWGAFGSIMRQTIIWLKSSGKRLCVEAHMTVDKEELSGVLTNFIHVPGSIKNVLSGWFEEAWEFYIFTSGMPPNEKAVRKIRTVPDARSVNLGLKTSAGLASTMDADASTILAALSK